MNMIEEVHALPGHGVAGDRYCVGTGYYSNKPGPDRQLTLIELEVVETVAEQLQIRLAPGDARRNVVTRGVSLNDLVGTEFVIGDVVLRGVRLCDPCAYLGTLLGEARVLKALVRRGGLRAEILTEGWIRVDDPIFEKERTLAQQSRKNG